MEKKSQVQPGWLQTEENEIDEEYGSGSDIEKSNDSQIKNTSRSESDSYSGSESDNCNNNNNNNQDTDDESDKNGNILLGKDKKTEWFLDPPNQRRRTAKRSIVLRLPNVKQSAQSAKTPLEFWKQFFPDTCVEEIVKNMNIHLEKLRINYDQESSVRPTSVDELHAFLGLLYMLGLYKASHLNLREYWTTDSSAPDCFRAVMSLNRFRTLMTAITFDDLSDRERKKLGNLVPIREFSSGFIQRCQENYSVGPYTTVDEMLEGFKGRCKFRQYIPNKPAKYGIKIHSLADSKTFYTLNMEIYCGKQPPGPYEQSNSAFHLVERLISPICNTKTTSTRRLYSRKLSKQFIQPYLLIRSEIPTLSLDLKNIIHTVGEISVELVETSNSARQLCRFCPRQKNIYFKKACSVCNIFICPKHATLLCPQCETLINRDED